jgi:hypothetical protein
MPPQRNPDLENDKDAILVSIYGPLDQIARLLENKAPNPYFTRTISDLKTHTHGFLNYIFDNTPDGDANYRDMPKTPADLMGKTGAMLSHIDQDITSMRGYLKGKPSATYIALFRHLRDYVDKVLSYISKNLVDENTTISGMTSGTLTPNAPKPVNASAKNQPPVPVPAVNASSKILPKPAVTQGSKHKSNPGGKNMNKKSP